MTDKRKSDFMQRLEAARAEWLALLDQVPAERREEPGVVGKWSVRDLIVHIDVWETWGANVARSIAEGRKSSDEAPFGVAVPPEMVQAPFDEFNEWLVEQRAGRSYAQVVADEQAAYERYVAAFNLLDDDDLMKPARSFRAISRFGDDTLWDVMADQSFNHYAEHAAQIRDWLARSASAGSVS